MVHLRPLKDEEEVELEEELEQEDQEPGGSLLFFFSFNDTEIFPLVFRFVRSFFQYTSELFICASATARPSLRLSPSVCVCVRLCVLECVWLHTK